MMYGRRIGALGLVLIYMVSFTIMAQPQTGTLKMVGTAWIQAPAVSKTPEGYVGALTNITVMVTEGWGDVYISTFSLTEKDFQGAATTAAREAARLLGLDFRKYNFYFRIKSPAVIIGGPSAGVAMTVAVYAALSGREINRSVMVTGMIAPDGTVGPVGGVFEKAQAVASAGGKVFLVPPGQSVVVQYKTVVRKVGPFRFYSVRPVTIDLKEYAWKNWGLRVVEVATIEDALGYFFGVRREVRQLPVPPLSRDARSRLVVVWRRLEGEAKRQLEDASKLVEESGLSGFVRRQLEAALEKYGRSEYRVAENAREGDVSGFEGFKRAIAASVWVKGLVEYYSSGNLTGLIDMIEEKLNSTVERVEEMGTRDFLDINFKVLAADSVLRAKRSMLVSRERWSSDPQDSLYYAGLAYASIVEAECYLDLLPREGLSGIEVPKLAETYLSVARSTWPYVLTVIQETGGPSRLIDAAGQYFELATEFYLKKMYLLALVSSVRSVALSEAAMSYLQQALSGKTVYLDYSRNQALRTLSRGADIVAGIYYANMSALTESLSEKIALYKLASYMGELVLELSAEYGVKQPGKASAKPVTQAGKSGGNATSVPERAPEVGAGESGSKGLEELISYLREAWRIFVEKEYLLYTVIILLLLAALYAVSKKAGERE